MTPFATGSVQEQHHYSDVMQLSAFYLLAIVLADYWAIVKGCDSRSHILSNVTPIPVHHRELEGEKDELQCGSASPSDWQRYKLESAFLDWKSQYQTSALARAITIPVYFHVLAFNDTHGTLKEAIITDGFLTKLNNGFRDTPFNFVLQDIDTTIDEELFACNETRQIQETLHRGTENALNAYVCNTYGWGASGWSSLPPDVTWDTKSDGIFVMNPQVSGDFQANYQSLVHEAGHWLGLSHTFDGGCSPQVESYHWGIYTFAGDGVADTPAHSGPTQDRKGKHICWQTDPPLNTCADDIHGVDPGNDPVTNYMNYGTGYCRETYGEFTAGQTERMVAEYDIYRSPTRRMNCGCPYSCTREVLKRIPRGQQETCRQLIRQSLRRGYPEFYACRRRATRFRECRPCHPIHCSPDTE